jgi:D-alanyl-D-alanine carboxypeptidase (penicillin-binding protein 5/6)
MAGEIKRQAYTRNLKDLFFSSFIPFIIVFLLLVSNCFAMAVRSRAAVAIDASTGEILFSKSPNRQLPPASTTKLMTAIVVMENEDLSKVTTISHNASHVEPSKAGFKEGDKVTIEGLLYAALIGSANDAAVALAEAVAGSEARFVQLMNEKAVSIGASHTRFINSNGLPGDGQHTTALDLSKIMNYAMRYPKLREIIATPKAHIVTEEGKAIFLRNTDKLLWLDERVIGGKTGYTRSARHCFVCVAANENKMIIVTLLGSPSRKKLWMETERLIEKVFS